MSIRSSIQFDEGQEAMSYFRLLKSKQTLKIPDAFQPPQLPVFDKPSPMIGFTLSVLVVIFLIGFVLVKGQSSTPKPRMVQVHFDIKAIDDYGQPLSGAKIFLKNKRVGTTDSFGEWQRYFKLTTGSQWVLKITKSETQEALKNIAIPLQLAAGQDISITQTIQVKTAVMQPKKVVQVQPTLGISFQYDHWPEESLTPFSKALSSVLRNKGIFTTENPWSVFLIPVEGLDQSMTRVVANFHDKTSDSKIDFLFNLPQEFFQKKFSPDFLGPFAEGLVDTLVDIDSSTQIELKKILIRGLLHDSMDVFVGGRKAKLEKSGQWLFQVQGNKSFVTILQDQKIIFRTPYQGQKIIQIYPQAEVSKTSTTRAPVTKG